MQACGRLTDIEFFGHRHEVAQVTSFHGHDTYPVSSCHQIDIIQALFCDSSFATEMKNKPALEIDRRANFRAPSEKLNLTKHLVGFWRDLEDKRFPAPAKRVQPRDGTRRDQKAAPPAKITTGRAWLCFLFMLLANYLLMSFLFPS